MNVEVDTRSPTPHYEQIRQQITSLVLTGSLREGDRLPPIRQLAGHLGVSNGVVARAYNELEREETVTTNGKKGTLIAARAADSTAAKDVPERKRLLVAAAVEFAITAHALGFDLTAAETALQSAMSSPGSLAASQPK